MTTTTERLLPGGAMPAIEVTLADGRPWTLAANRPQKLLLIDVFRGLHCGRCMRHLEELNERMDSLRALGVDFLAVSADPADRGARLVQEWNVGAMQVAHGLDLDVARRLGCYISRSIKEGENDLFAEPGVFYVRPDLTLFGAVINSFPGARPTAEGLIELAEILVTRDYPARGTER